ncbi:hypothetical protein D3C74_323790 [compost metagenome]
MVRSGEIIANRLRAVRPEENRPGILHPPQITHRILHDQFKMLRRQLINHVDSFFDRIDE